MQQGVEMPGTGASDATFLHLTLGDHVPDFELLIRMRAQRKFCRLNEFINHVSWAG